MSDSGDHPNPRAWSGAEPDEILAAAARAGDRAAFGRLYQRYAPPVYDYLARTVRDPHAAEDLLQTSFVRALEAIATLQDPARVRPWLYAIAHRQAMNHLTRSRPSYSIDPTRPAAAGRGPDELAGAGEAAELVWAAAGGLEPRQYAIVDLAVRQQLTTPEVAEVLDLDPKQAAVAVHRAKESLGQAVKALLLARSSQRCSRLAELVPAAPLRLSTASRHRIDRHLRRCSHCKDLASRLVSPEAVLAGLAPVALPAALLHGGWAAVLHQAGLGGLTPGPLPAGHVAAVPPPGPPPAAGNPTATSPQPPARKWWASRPAVAATTAVVVAAGASAIALAAGRGGHPALVPTTAAPTTTAAVPAPALAVPNLVGRRLRPAVIVLRGFGLRARPVKVVAAGPAGIIVAEEPIARTAVAPGSTVVLFVSSAPPAASAPTTPVPTTPVPTEPMTTPTTPAPTTTTEAVPSTTTTTTTTTTLP